MPWAPTFVAGDALPLQAGANAELAWPAFTPPGQQGWESDDEPDGRTTKLAMARIWRGRTRRDVADEYERYNYEGGIKPVI